MGRSKRIFVRPDAPAELRMLFAWPLLGLFIVCSWTLGSATLLAQLAPQTPQAAYEGQNVSAISLIANPHRDLRPLFQVVTQQAGSPYSNQKIQESADALKRAGNFPKVEVRVVPDINGLRLSFLLEPAYYVGVVEFPDAVKRFSYTRLLQVANISDEDPYDPSVVQAAEKSLSTFFEKNGYFQSKIHLQTAIDDSHQLVNITFASELGRRAKISTVKIEGSEQPLSGQLLHAVQSVRAQLSRGSLKRGKPYSPARIRSASSLMKRVLSKQRRLAGSIRENPPQYNAEKNEVDVSFTVEVGPVVNIRTVGARLTVIPFLTGRQMRKLIPIYSEGTVDRDLVEEGQRNLIDYFQKKGYGDVTVTIDFKREPEQILIVYKIDKGKKQKVSAIAFRGNRALSSDELASLVTVKKSHIWSHGSLSQKLLKRSAENIEATYRDHGYQDAKVTPKTTENSGKINIAFEIEEGAETMVENVQVSGNEHVAYDQLTIPKGFLLRPGIAFSPRKLADDRNRISATYLNRGYLNVEVKAAVARVPGDANRVNITYAIVEHQLVRVSEVLYLGQEHTQERLIEKTAHLSSESPMLRDQLLESESRLYNLTIFDWSSVGPRKPITDQNEETTLVKVHEAKRNEITYGFGFEVSHRGGNVPTGTVAVGGGTIGLGGKEIAPSQSTFASPRGLIEYTRRNMRGLAETASASLLLSRLDQKALATYGQPHFIGSQWQSLTSFSIERNSENPLFTAGTGDISFQVEREISRKYNTRLQVRYDFNKTDLSHILVPDLVLEPDQHVRLSTVSAILVRDTRDKPLDAHRGSFSTVDFAVTPTAFGSSANFTKVFGQYAFYQPFHSMVLANSVRLGIAAPFAGSFVPTSQLFFSGGGTTLRSFPISQAGPQRIVPFCNVLQGESGCVNVTVPVGGKQIFILNSEVRFPTHIAKPLGAVIFYDGGNVFSAVNLHTFVGNYTNTVGIGLRYSTPIGPVRFDIGHNLNPIPGIKSTQYYITIGQAF